ncbi:hypothetical protein DCC39_09430 [Pueribacillus theae]|uniref:Uncharacterized protein n=1 Tax=Pueribacillus theae TaxID=2171751 RepID=A0A2U1K1Q8_9BACI|nr:hypothetical protein [Pueribacillus theae]PWA11185.1 hypothetical protein DCC39_09430 [Pueribacillus theae]
MINNKVYLFFAVGLFIITMVLNFPFPHNIPYSEAVISVLNIPIRSANGFHYVGITTLLFLFAGLYFLAKSLKKYRVRSILIAVIFILVFPQFLVIAYQKTVAAGIYAISYEQDTSICRFNKTGENTLRGMCELTFKNHSKNDVSFDIIFYEHYPFEEDIPMVSLMNSGAPFETKLKGKERKRIKLETDIDLSKMKSRIDGGEANSVNVIIRQGEKSRNL